jgi:uncharacterized protein (TIGR00251 family)
VIITVRVTPKSKRSELRHEGELVFRAKIMSPPDKGNANRELIGLVADHFQVKKSQVQIIRGEHSRDKVLEIQD